MAPTPREWSQYLFSPQPDAMEAADLSDSLCSDYSNDDWMLDFMDVDSLAYDLYEAELAGMSAHRANHHYIADDATPSDCIWQDVSLDMLRTMQLQTYVVVRAKGTTPDVSQDI